MTGALHVDRVWRSFDGLDLYARDYGAAAGAARLPVICLHGLTRNSKDFEEVAPWIAETGRRVLAVDVRGRGRSARDPNPMNYHPGTYARDILGLMDALGLSRAIFVGTSMGGLIAMTLGALRPLAVAGLVLNDVGPEVSPVGLGRIAGYVGRASSVTSWAEAAAYARDTNGVAFPDFTAPDWDRFARRLFRDDSDGRPVLDYDPDIAVPIKAASTAAVPPDLWPLFTTLANAVPTLLVRGALSDLLDLGIADRMRAAAPAMGYAEVPRVGHAPLLSEPSARAAIERLLNTVP